MEARKHKLPADPEALKEIISQNEKNLQELEQYKQKYEELKIEHESLTEKFHYLQKMYFGRKSEKLTPEDTLQGRLFNEAEAYDADPDGDTETTDEPESNHEVTEVKGYTRKNKGRKPIPDDIPRETRTHDLSEEEKRCGCCGEVRPHIGEDKTERLEFIPAKIYVEQDIYLKYGPCKCEESKDTLEPEVISAPWLKRIIPGSIAGDGLLAHVFTAKFCDAIPFYRQSKMFERIDVHISRATMCNWAMKTVENMDLFFDVFTETLKSGNFIRMDETTIQVLNEENRDPGTKSYMWVATGYPVRGHPLILYDYHSTRAGYVPVEFLKGFKGYLQTDGYSGYNASVSKHELIHVGCMAHARREFHKAYKPKHKNSVAHKALMIIKKIYDIETDLRSKKLPDDVFVEKRRELVTPVLDKFHTFLVEAKETLVPSSLAGKAVNYTLNEWDKLIRYLDLACMTPDNNEIERSIRAFVIGRKNWIFANTPRGARSSAGMYSLIESAKANRLDPTLYLRFLFAKLPYVSDNRDELKKLLPCFVTEDQIQISE